MLDEDDDLLLASKLMKGCYEMYRHTATGVAYDSVQFVPHVTPSPNPPPTPPGPPPPVPTPSLTLTKIDEARDNAANLARVGEIPVGSSRRKVLHADVLEDAVLDNILDSWEQQQEESQQFKQQKRRRHLQQQQQQPEPTSGQVASNSAMFADQGKQPPASAAAAAAALSASTSRQDPKATTGSPAVGPRWDMEPQATADILRPEVVESLFYLWRATGQCWCRSIRLVLQPCPQVQVYYLKALHL